LSRRKDTPRWESSRGLNGTEFDKTYSQMMVRDHTTDISEFEKAFKKASDPDVKAYAQQTLPTLRHHLMLANRLSSAEKKSPSQMSGPAAEQRSTTAGANPVAIDFEGDRSGRARRGETVAHQLLGLINEPAQVLLAR